MSISDEYQRKQYIKYVSAVKNMRDEDHKVFIKAQVVLVHLAEQPLDVRQCSCLLPDLQHPG